MFIVNILVIRWLGNFYVSVESPEKLGREEFLEHQLALRVLSDFLSNYKKQA